MNANEKDRNSRIAACVMTLWLWLAASGGNAGAAGDSETDGSTLSAGVESGARAARVDRIDLINQIMNRWQPVAAAMGQDLVTWREVFSTQFGLMSDSVLRNVAAVKADAGSAAANHARFAQAIRDAGMQTYVDSQSGKGHAKLGSWTSDFVYIPVVPCRIVDTRNVGGPISSGFARNFVYYTNGGSFNFGTAQGGAPGLSGTVCPGTVFPDNAPQFAAAVVTLTVVSPTEAGNLVAWGGLNPIPTVSALNWTGPGQVLANTTAIPGGGRSGSGPGGGVLDFALYYNGPSGQAHFTADVVGYFVVNTATALDCTTISTDFTIPASNNAFSAVSGSCGIL